MDRLGVICEIILEPVGRQYLARKPRKLGEKDFYESHGLISQGLQGEGMDWRGRFRQLVIEELQ